MNKIKSCGLKMISTTEVDRLLAGADLMRGEWNQIASSTTDEASVSHRPLRDGLHLYVLSRNLASYLPKDGWLIVQFDNSSFIAQDVRELVEDLLIHAHGWSESIEALFIDDSERERESALATLIHWLLLFELHAGVASELWQNKLRIQVADGVVSFIGEASMVRDAAAWLKQATQNPLQLVDERFFS